MLIAYLHITLQEIQKSRRMRHVKRLSTEAQTVRHISRSRIEACDVKDSTRLRMEAYTTKKHTYILVCTNLTSPLATHSDSISKDSILQYPAPPSLVDDLRFILMASEVCDVMLLWSIRQHPAPPLLVGDHPFILTVSEVCDVMLLMLWILSSSTLLLPCWSLFSSASRKRGEEALMRNVALFLYEGCGHTCRDVFILWRDLQKGTFQKDTACAFRKATRSSTFLTEINI